MKRAILYLNAQQPGAIGLLGHVFDKMAAEGLLTRVFYDGTVRTREQFLADVLRPGSLPFVIMAGEEVACFTWLNSIEGRAARGHFTFFRKFWGRKNSVPIGRRYFRYALSRRDADGYLFDCIVGVTPRDNPLSWKFALECGCDIVGTIPAFLYMADTRTSVDAVAVAATREGMGVKDGEVTEAVWDA